MPHAPPPHPPADLQHLSLLQSIPSLILALDRNLHILYANDAYCRFVNMPLTDLIGRPLIELFPSFAKTRSYAAYQEALADAQWREAEGQVGTFYLHSRIYPTTYGLLAIADDRTDLHRTEMALKNTRDQLQAVLDAIPGLVSWIDSKMRYVGVNRMLCETFRRDSDFFIGQDIGFLDAQTEFSRFVREFAASDRQSDSREVMTTIDQVPRCFFVAAQKYGNEPCIVTAGIDISARKRIELDLQLTQARYRAVVEDQNDLICRYSPDRRVTFVNEAFCAFFGLTRNQLVGKSILDLLPGDDVLLALSHIRKLAPSRPTITFEHRAIRPDGSVRWLSRMDRGITDQHGTIIEYQSVARDITEKRVVEEALQQAYSSLEKRVLERTTDLRRLNRELESEIDERRRVERQLKESLAEKEVLLREVHHRVKNNLQVVYSLLDLQSGLTHDRAATGVLEESKLRIRAMAMIHDHLYKTSDFSRIRFDTYIRTLVEQIRISFGASADRIQIDLMITPVLLGLDTAISIGLILNELVTNAFKYAFPDDHPGSIRIGLMRKQEDLFELSVRDDGLGLPVDLSPESTGSFGLQLVQLLTSQLNGKLERNPSPGTHWSVLFPTPGSMEELPE